MLTPGDILNEIQSTQTEIDRLERSLEDQRIRLSVWLEVQGRLRIGKQKAHEVFGETPPRSRGSRGLARGFRGLDSERTPGKMVLEFIASAGHPVTTAEVLDALEHKVDTRAGNVRNSLRSTVNAFIRHRVIARDVLTGHLTSLQASRTDAIPPATAEEIETPEP